MQCVKVVFLPDGKSIEVGAGISILEAAKKVGITLESVCGGKGTCGKCRIIVEAGAGNLNKITKEELNLVKIGKFSQELLDRGYRLACMTKIEKITDTDERIVVTVPIESRLGAQKILVEGLEKELKFNPLIKKYFVELPQPTLSDPKPDLERILEGLKANNVDFVETDYKIFRELPEVLRKGNWNCTVTIWNDKEIISIESGDTSKRKYGLAVDIGTTTVVGYLIDLNDGKLVSVGSILNPQIPYGEDVVTRITYCIQNEDGLERINRAIIDGLNKIIDEACSKANVKKEEIYEITIVGNTAMHHLFLKLNPKFLALSPFTPVLRRGVDVKARELGLKTNPNANVHVLPVIAGFVGADTVGVILSTDIYKESEMTLATDIGTNGEIMLGNKDYIEVCSTAAGPAFEGAHLKHGMRGEPGAIEKVSIKPDTLEVEYSTIDNLPPKGICGSGIVDAVAQMFLAGVVLRNGNINPAIESPRIRRNQNMLEFVLVWENETEKGIGDIVITQRDIREIQLAKAALYSGAKILMKRRQVEEKNIDRVYLAGAFGTYIDKLSAKVIGLYPDIPLSKVKSVGNAAGMGAKQALISREKREDAEAIARNTRYLELTIAPEFNDEFISAMYFPHAKIDRFPSLRKKCEELPGWSEILKS
ncbi:MAG: ASKHA domain-containing protein [Candidatus Hadarchaeum sp.]|uniref:ASKHA domain-containing protein n=1 Tax=Candidatus Hadarchaeum sp. TaxID=2883567 RepID=UPI00317C3F7F